MPKPVVIFGITEFAQVAKVYLEADSPYEVAAFTVDQHYITEPSLLGTPIVPFETLQKNYPPDRYAMYTAIGFSKVNKVRESIYQRCKTAGYEMITYVNSKAMSWGQIEIGENCFIFESNVIQPFVKIGNNVVLWSGNHIGHHSTIEDHCFIASHVVISGGCTIGQNTFIGVNATFRDHITVGPYNVIGAGAVIMGDTPERAVFKGKKDSPSAVTSDQLNF
jgi:sugar O-acyltransferase (sialic acid O-acetyltransferase NeuD family)